MRRRNYHEYLQTVLNTPKKHYLNQATKKILAKSFLQKIPKSKSHPLKSFDLPCHLKSGVPNAPTPPPTPPGAQALSVKSASDIKDFRNICYNEGAVIEWFRFLSLPLLYSYHFSSGTNLSAPFFIYLWSNNTVYHLVAREGRLIRRFTVFVHTPP